MATHTITTLDTYLCDRCTTTGLDATVPFTRCDCGGTFKSLRTLTQGVITQTIADSAKGLLDKSDPTRGTYITDLAYCHLALRALETDTHAN